MRVAIIPFSAKGTGSGTQTVTGVSDEDGDFTGEVVIFQSGLSAVNTVESSGAGTYMDARGVDTGAVRSALSASGLYSGFNFKAQDTGLSLGDFSFASVLSDSFGSGVLYRESKVSAFRSGEFDIDYTINARTGDTILAIVMAEIDIAFTADSNGVKSMPSKPQGLLSLPVLVPASSGGTSAATGGHSVEWGFATRDGDYGTACVNIVNQGNNFSAQLATAFTTGVDGIGVLSSDAPTVSAWNDTALTIANYASGGLGIPCVFCGETVVCAGGVFDEGTASFDVGFSASLVFFLSIGYPTPGSTVHNTIGQMATGWASGHTVVSQAGYWAGEKTVGNSGTGYGARYLSDDTAIRLGSPNGPSTTYTSVMAVTAIGTDGIVELDWTTTSGDGSQIWWFAIGEEIVPPPVPTPVYRTREVVRRRLRRAPIVWSEKGGLQTRVRINLFAVDMQPGVGTSDTPDPLVMIRASKDGGFTWGNERRLTAGRVGEFFERINAWQWGQGRDWVFEVSCTDPVLWNLVGAYFDAEGGEN